VLFGAESERPDFLSERLGFLLRSRSGTHSLSAGSIGGSPFCPDLSTKCCGTHAGVFELHPASERRDQIRSAAMSRYWKLPFLYAVRNASSMPVAREDLARSSQYGMVAAVRSTTLLGTSRLFAISLK
jgi:hypothetical protein